MRRGPKTRCVGKTEQAIGLERLKRFAVPVAQCNDAELRPSGGGGEKGHSASLWLNTQPCCVPTCVQLAATNEGDFYEAKA